MVLTLKERKAQSPQVMIRLARALPSPRSPRASNFPRLVAEHKGISFRAAQGFSLDGGHFTKVCPAGGHPLKEYRTFYGGYTCSMCDRVCPRGTTLRGCRECDWDLCLPCDQLAAAAHRKSEAKAALAAAAATQSAVSGRRAIGQEAAAALGAMTLAAGRLGAARAPPTFPDICTTTQRRPQPRRLLRWLRLRPRGLWTRTFAGLRCCSCRSMSQGRPSPRLHSVRPSSAAEEEAEAAQGKCPIPR